MEERFAEEAPVFPPARSLKKHRNLIHRASKTGLMLSRTSHFERSGTLVIPPFRALDFNDAWASCKRSWRRRKSVKEVKLPKFPATNVGLKTDSSHIEVTLIYPQP